MRSSMRNKINIKQQDNKSAILIANINYHSHQGGYALIAIVTFMMIVGAMATGGMDLSINTERLAGNAIQRTRSFQAADGAATIAEDHIEDMMQNRSFADMNGTNGIFSRAKRSRLWWREDGSATGHVSKTDAFLGVVSPPRYAVEQVGDYISDGGTGVVNLDIGGAAYGRLSAGGREILLFNVESHGKGSFETVDTVVETTVAISY